MLKSRVFGHKSVDVDYMYISLIDRFLTGCLRGQCGSGTYMELAFRNNHLFVHEEPVVRWDNGILLVDRRIKRDNPAYRHMEAFSGEQGVPIVRVRNTERPDDAVNLTERLGDIKRILERDEFVITTLHARIREAVWLLENLRAYCARYLPNSGDPWYMLSVPERALLRVRDVLLDFGDIRGEPPPPVMTDDEYKQWVDRRLAVKPISSVLVRSALSEYTERHMMVFLRISDSPILSVFRRSRGRFRPALSLTAWIRHLATRYGDEKVPDLYTGILKILASPYIPVSGTSVNVKVKRDTYSNREGGVRCYPYLEFTCPCCSKLHRHRPVVRTDASALMSIPLRACCLFSPDEIVLHVANYTVSEMEEVVLECALVND